MPSAKLIDSLHGRRLKQQLMREQDDEEEKVRWRVEAEVKLALQEAQAAQSQRGLADQGLHHVACCVCHVQPEVDA